MKLYMHPVSMTSRPVRLFAAESKIPIDEQVVDLFTGEHNPPAYAAANPSCLVRSGRGATICAATRSPSPTTSAPAW